MTCWKCVHGQLYNCGQVSGPATAACVQDFVVKQLQQIPGVSLVVPQGAFYCLPVMNNFFGPTASVDGFGSIPDADTLCR